MQAEINTLTSTHVPRSLTELITLGRTLKRRTTDIQAYFDHPHTTSDPTQAINAPLEHQRSRAPGLSKTSPTTSPEHSPKQENSNPNHTPNYEEPVNVHARRPRSFPDTRPSGPIHACRPRLKPPCTAAQHSLR